MHILVKTDKYEQNEFSYYFSLQFPAPEMFFSGLRFVKTTQPVCFACKLEIFRLLMNLTNFLSFYRQKKTAAMII